MKFSASLIIRISINSELSKKIVYVASKAISSWIEFFPQVAAVRNNGIMENWKRIHIWFMWRSRFKMIQFQI